MNAQSRVIVPFVALALLGAVLARPLSESIAQDGTPIASDGTPLEIPLRDLGGRDIGIATLADTPDGLSLSLSASGLTPGEHGIHFHQTGVCDTAGDAPFGTAGDHVNPTGMMHGGTPVADAAVAEQPRHAGDLGNLTADAAGVATFSITLPEITLGPGPYSLADEDGTALIIHEGVDDLTTDPSGDSGARVACGVVAGSQVTAASPAASPGVVPIASPVASPGASPAASPVAGGTLPTEVTVTSVDIDFLEDAVTIAAETDTRFILPNQGTSGHNFTIDELGVSVDIAPGETAEVTINAPAGVYEYYCNVPGHAAAGQVGTLTVQ